MFNEKCYNCFNFSAGDPFECVDCYDNGNFVDICSVYGKKEEKKMTYGEKLSSMKLIDILTMMEENRRGFFDDAAVICVRDLIIGGEYPCECSDYRIENCRKCLLDLLGSEYK